MKSPIQLFIAIAVLLAAATVTAQVYRWVDKDGKVQFSDQPPPNDAKVIPKKVDAKPAAGPAAASVARDGKASPTSGKDGMKAGDKNTPPPAPLTLEERNKAFEKRRADEAEAEKKAVEKAKMDRANSERCNEARRYLRDLESGRPIGGTDESGNRKILDDSERASELTKARTAMTESCK